MEKKDVVKFLFSKCICVGIVYDIREFVLIFLNLVVLNWIYYVYYVFFIGW